MSRGNFGENSYFSIKKMFSKQFSELEKKDLWICLRNIFGRFPKTIPPLRWTFWGTQNSFQNKSSCCESAFWFWARVCAGLSKLHSPCPEELQYEYGFPWKKIKLKETSSMNFCITEKNFQHSFQNYRKISRKALLLKLEEEKFFPNLASSLFNIKNFRNN